MKKNIIVLVMALFVFLIGGFWLIGIIPPDSRSYHHSVTESIDLSNENIGGLYLSDKINSKKITSKYGELSVPNPDIYEYDYYDLTKNIKVATKKDDYEIVRFCVYNENLKSEITTEKGVRLGDSKEKVINSYGENYYTRLEQGTDIIGYVDKEKNYSIEFWLGYEENIEEENVWLIRFDYNYMI